MFLFNSTISHMRLTEIILEGKKYTWSNMQNAPLLEKLDWVFTNDSWTLSYPETVCTALVKECSDHNPLRISISTNIPKAHIFRFENFLLLRDAFTDILAANWFASPMISDKAKILTNKCKNLRAALKVWSASLPSLKIAINNISLTIQLLDALEKFRDLSLEEWNFRTILKGKLLLLLEQQRVYWKQRGAIKWATLGDAGTNSFMQMLLSDTEETS